MPDGCDPRTLGCGGVRDEDDDGGGTSPEGGEERAGGLGGVGCGGGMGRRGLLTQSQSIAFARPFARPPLHRRHGGLFPLASPHAVRDGGSLFSEILPLASLP